MRIFIKETINVCLYYVIMSTGVVGGVPRWLPARLDTRQPEFIDH